MKKAVGMAILSVLGLIAAWALLELIANGFSLNMAIRTMTEPVYLVVGGILATGFAVYNFMETRKKASAASAH